ncbi:MAG: tetratricopeptide repeat protein [Deltaproteobacteria bacterium]|nr:tetratricopeptide repeat protein [Deltaproteobacteria bacterium]
MSRFTAKTLPLVLLAGLSSLLITPPAAHASIPNRVYRVDIRPKKDHTRITVRLQGPPRYTLTTLPGNRLRLIMQDTGGPLFRKFRAYSDVNIGGLTFSRRGANLLMTFQFAPGAGWRDLNLDGVSAITLDVGKPFNPGPPHPTIPGRERIWNGVEKLVRDFDPPLKPEIPFLPTDRQILKEILDESGQQAFVAAEAALYKGRLSEAEEIFTHFATLQTPVRSLALYRLGETLYKLQKYPQALAAFREAERLWAAYLGFNPGVAFYYGDSIARSGDLAAGRTLLAHLIARLADKNYAPALLVRMADVLVRQGHDREALAVYRTVAENYKDNKAGQLARLRLADRDFLAATPWNYRRLGETYQDISSHAGDPTVREESHFKHVLLGAIHDEAPEALRQVVIFQKKFPQGVYATVCRTMREVLVTQVYRETWRAGEGAGLTSGVDRCGGCHGEGGVSATDMAALVRFVEEHHDYLSGCIEQPEFLPKVVAAYEEAGRPIELIKLFTGLLDRQWAAAGAPFMHEEIAEKADLLGDTVLAEKMLRSFLRKYPTHSRARPIMERLGGIYFGEQRYQEARDTLLWLFNRGERAQRPESYYYLGRSLWNQKGFAQAARAMELYVASGATGEGASLMPDAYYVASSAREALGDRKGALRLIEAGIRQSANERNEGLLYKAGELNLLDGRKGLARDYFEQVAKRGKDPDWQKMAQQALESLEASDPPGVSR